MKQPIMRKTGIIQSRSSETSGFRFIRFSLFCFRFLDVLNLQWYFACGENGLNKGKSNKSEPMGVQICCVFPINICKGSISKVTRK